MLTLNGKYVTSDGDPASGRVTFAPVIAAANTTLDAWVTTGPVTVALDGSGAFSVSLLASDDPAWSADGDIAYRVIEELSGVGRRTYLVTLPDPGPYDLHELQPEPTAPTVTMVPVPGPAGPGVAAGGATGEVLAKSSATDYDTEWVPLAHAASHADGGDDQLDVADLASGAATAGHVPTANGSGGVAWAAQTGSAGGSTMWVDVKDHGAVGDGVTDDSTAIKAAVAALIGSYSSGADQRPTGILLFPPGDYYVTEQDTLWPGSDDPTAGDYLKMRGLHVMGAGKYATVITFDPDLSAEPANKYDGNLMTALSGDPDSHPSAVGGATWQEVRFEGISFKSDNQYARFAYLYCWNGRPQSDISFSDCEWHGTWQRAFGLDGPATSPVADQNSEIEFTRCGTRDDTVFTDAFLHAGLTDDGDLDQQVNYSFINCSMEYKSGDCLRFDRGGSIRVWGGSWILGINDTGETACTMFRLGNNGAAFGNYANKFLSVVGTRFEMRHVNAQIIESRWASPASHISFIGTHQADSGGSGNADWRPYHFHQSAYGTGYVLFQNATLFGGIKVTRNATPSGQFGGKLVFDMCTFWNYPTGGLDGTSGTSVGTATCTNGSTTITLTSHGLSEGDVIAFTSLSGITGGITAGTKYTVRSATANTFTIRANNGSMWNSSITVSVSGAGTASVTKWPLIEHGGTAPEYRFRDCYVTADAAS